MIYSIEVVSVSGGMDILQWHKRKTKKASLNLAKKLSVKYKSKGKTHEGFDGQECVWVEVFNNDYEKIEHYQFIDGVQVYYSNGF